MRPMILLRRVDGEAPSDVSTGLVDLLSHTERTLIKQEPDGGAAGHIHVPNVYPYTHTHIEELGEWPQRLLHVPSMTSYEWQPGNYYGGHREPQYRALSYTWGRWRLEHDEYPEIGNLPIRGVPWQIPRIHPHHFGVQEFQDIVNRVCEPVQAHNAIDMAADIRILRGLSRANFIWLDVACIDQRWGPVAALEVGRQAGIFKKATGVAIWLSQSGKDVTSFARLQELFTSLICRSNEILWTERPSEVLLKEMLAGVQELFCDPWFTSLWTLQEAYLSQDAYLISAWAEPFKLLPVHGWTPGVFTLNLLTSACGSIAYQIRQILKNSASADPEFVSFCKGVQIYLQKSGLSVLIRNGNPLCLLSAAGWRVTSHEQDRVYGIMQVFKYRLGASAPDADPIRAFSQSELVDQLGAAMFKDRPVQSQLHCFTEVVDRTKGWHINTSSMIPNLYTKDNDWKSCEAKCKFSIKHVDGVTLGYFEGKACWFVKLAVAWEAVDAQQGLTSDRPTGDSVCHILPDVTEYLHEHHRHSLGISTRDDELFSELALDESAARGPIEFANNLEAQHRFANWLCERFGENRLLVLIMGRMAARTCGLILLHAQVGSISYWHRIGTCTWWHASASIDSRGYDEILRGENQDWVDCQGLFG
jgi:hypothetical protein